MIRAIAWDIDGTLVDSEPRHHRALIAASRNFGVDLSDLPDQAFAGTHMPDVWALIGGRYPRSVTRAAFIASVERHYAEDEAAMAIMPGARETIERLHEAGFAQICVSNSSRVVVDANLTALGVADRLVGAISLDDVPRGKPDPIPYRQACHRLGFEPQRVLAVEDSATGLASAHAAGLPTAFYRGTHPSASCRKEGLATHIIADLYAVAAIALQP